MKDFLDEEIKREQEFKNNKEKNIKWNNINSIYPISVCIIFLLISVIFFLFWNNDKYQNNDEVERIIKKVRNEGITELKINIILEEAEKNVLSNNPEAAENLYRQIEDYSFIAQDYLGIVSLRKGEPDKAEQYYKKAAESGYDISMLHLGTLYMYQGKYEEAEKWIISSIEQGNMNAYTTLLNLYYISKNNEKFEELSKKLLKFGFNFINYELGNYYLREKRYKEAKDAFEKADKSFQINAERRIQELEEVLKNKDNEKMIRDLLMRLENNPKKEIVDIIYREAQKQFILDKEKAKEYFMKIEKYSLNAKLYIAEYYEERNEMESFRKWIDNAIEAGSVEAKYKRSFYILQEENYEKAKEYYEDIEKYDKDYTFLEIGNFYANYVDNYEKAEEYYLKSIERTESPIPMIELALLYQRQKKNEEREKILLKASEKGSIIAKKELMIIYYDQKKFEESFKIADELAELNEINGIFYKGLIKNEMEEYREAYKFFEMAGNRGNILAMYNAALIYDRMFQYNGNKFDVVISWLIKASENGNSLAMHELGMIHVREGNINLARKWLSEAVYHGKVDAIENLRKL